VEVPIGPDRDDGEPELFRRRTTQPIRARSFSFDDHGVAGELAETLGDQMAVGPVAVTAEDDDHLGSLSRPHAWLHARQAHRGFSLAITQPPRTTSGWAASSGEG